MYILFTVKRHDYLFFFLLITTSFHSVFQSQTFMPKGLAKITVHSPLIFVSLLVLGF